MDGRRRAEARRGRLEQLALRVRRRGGKGYTSGNARIIPFFITVGFRRIVINAIICFVF